jgi:hypothetical protein
MCGSEYSPIALKWVAFTVLGLVLLAAIGGIVLRANMPTAKLTVHMVRPINWPPSENEEPRWPMWEVAITNTGRATADYSVYAHATDNGPLAFDLPRFGALSNGESARIGVSVPPDVRTNWVVTVKYWARTSPVENRLNAWLKPLPMLRNLLPNSDAHYASDVWHTGTNVATAR